MGTMFIFEQKISEISAYVNEHFWKEKMSENLTNGIELI
jgi:hypothetical protein